MMFNKFTERAQKVLVYAQEEAEAIKAWLCRYRAYTVRNFKGTRWSM